MIKYAQVGEHKTYLQSLDVRTLGIAGGSMIRVQNEKIVDVGPRSAHIAGVEYECFQDTGRLNDLRVELVSPREDDPAEYAVVKAADGTCYPLTLVGAANLLGYVPEGDYARGNTESARIAWQALGELLQVSAEQPAWRWIWRWKLAAVVSGLIQEYELDKNFVTFVGGGGSGAVIVNALAEKMQVKCRIAKNAPYISTIGVALAMVREQLGENDRQSYR